MRFAEEVILAANGRGYTQIMMVLNHPYAADKRLMAEAEGALCSD
jgi:hypothetical protein